MRTSPREKECVLCLVGVDGAIQHVFICGNAHELFYLPRRSKAKVKRHLSIEALIEHHKTKRIDPHMPVLVAACPRPAVKQ